MSSCPSPLPAGGDVCARPARAVAGMATLKVPSQKVILCGEYGVGKSSLFRRFAMDTFVSASDRRSTLGLDQFEKTYSVGPDQRQIKVKTRKNA